MIVFNSRYKYKYVIKRCYITTFEGSPIGYTMYVDLAAEGDSGQDRQQRVDNDEQLNESSRPSVLRVFESSHRTSSRNMKTRKLYIFC